jgi:GNAT superfamily N-acetyltransferase
MSDDWLFRQMTRQELDVLVDWAAAEGWNPGLGDAEVFWTTDPEGFVAAEEKGELVGGGSIVSYGGVFGFMGFFIVRPDRRGAGLGDRLWHLRRDRLLDRLQEPKVIGMDGVFAMQGYYTRGGFELFCRDLRFEGRGGEAAEPPGVVALETRPFEEVAAYDRRHFPAPRETFLRGWLAAPGSQGVAALRDGRLAGYSVLRRCRVGFKVGPLFADDAEIAEDLFVALSRRVPGEPLFLDVPEVNPAALELVRRHHMEEVFGCARMYLGPAPDLPHQEIFGVTTFELG